MASRSDQELSRLLVERGVLSLTTLHEIMGRCAQESPPIPLLDGIARFAKEGLIPSEVADKAQKIVHAASADDAVEPLADPKVAARRSDEALAQYLLDRGVLPEDELKKHFDDGPRRGERLAPLLVERGALDREALTEAHAKVLAQRPVCSRCASPWSSGDSPPARCLRCGGDWLKSSGLEAPLKDDAPPGRGPRGPRKRGRRSATLVQAAKRGKRSATGAGAAGRSRLPLVFALLIPILGAAGLGVAWSLREPVDPEAELVSYRELLTLKQRGLDDGAIQKDLEKRKLRIPISPRHIRLLRAAGLGNRLLSWLRERSERRALTIDDLLRWQRDNRDLDFVLARLDAATKLPTLTASDRERLESARLPAPALRALQRRPLDADDIARLAASIPALERLIDLVGARVSADELSRPPLTGLPEGIRARIERESRMDRGPADGTLRFRPLDLCFRLDVPSRWSTARLFEGGYPVYRFGPDDDSKARFEISRVDHRGRPLHRRSPNDLFRRALEAWRLREPGLNIGALEPAGKIDGAPALKAALSGRLQGVPSGISGWAYGAVKGTRFFLMAAAASRSGYLRYEKRFNAIRDSVRLGPPRAKPGPAMTAEALRARDRKAVVRIIAGDDSIPDQAVTSGFIAREDGIVVTTYSALFNVKTGKLHPRLTIAWEAGLEMAEREATYLSGAWDGNRDLAKRLTIGDIDLALLKIEGGGRFDRIKAAPCGSLSAGDALAAIGFPASLNFEGRSENSLYVAADEASRVVHDRRGLPSSIETAIKVDRGNNGAPCYRLADGAAVALANRSGWHSLREDVPQLAEFELDTLVETSSLRPLQEALERFPQFLAYPLGFDEGFGVFERVFLAYDLMAAGLPFAALSEAQEALKIDARSRDALLATLRAARKARDPATAERAAQTLLELDPRDGVAILERARMFRGSRRYDDAIELLRREADPRARAQRQLELARSLAGKTRLAEAITEAQKAAGAVSGWSRPLELAGGYAFKLERWDEGLALFAKALELNPESPAALRGMGQADELRGRYEQAVAVYEGALERRSERPDLWEHLGRCQAAAGQAADAAASFEKALALREAAEDPWRSRPLIGLAKLAGAAKDWPKALELIARAMACSVGNSETAELHVEASLILAQSGLGPGPAFAHAAWATSIDRNIASRRPEVSSIPQAIISADELLKLSEVGWPEDVICGMMNFAPCQLDVSNKEAVRALVDKGIPPVVLVAALGRVLQQQQANRNRNRRNQ